MPRSMMTLAFCLLLLGCGASDEGTQASDGKAAALGAAASAIPDAASAVGPANADTAAPETPGEDLGQFRIAAVLLGSAVDEVNVVRADEARFSPGDTLHASVLSVGPHQGLRMAATWRGPSGVVIHTTEQPVVPTRANAATFSLRHPDGWPTGEYGLEIAVNGRVVHSRDFEVR